MKQRVISLLLAFLLLTAPALSATQSVGQFERTKSYTGQFSDLSPSSTFYDNVCALYEYGLSVGKTDGTFGVSDPVTVGQVVILAGRIRSLYSVGDAESGAAAYRQPDSQAYQPYLAYIQAEGIVADELNGSYASAATRSVVAHVLANTLPSSALPAVNDALVTQAYASQKFITDVTEYTPYYQDILSLYRTGLSKGSDQTGSFCPGSTITRGALAAMITRMVDEDLRITLAWNLSSAFSAEGTGWGDLISGSPAYIASPTTTAEIAQDVSYMLSKNSNTLSLTYDTGISPVLIRQVMNDALTQVKKDCEQCYNSVNVSYSLTAGKVTLMFGAADCTNSQLQNYRNYTLSSAISVHDALWESGEITSTMTEYKKAQVYFDWICQNCTYDYSAQTNSISHIAYSLFKNGTAVCDGYTGAYNLLLKLEGISCYALSNETHIWTVATLDGTEYHIDTTWGDGGGSSINESYFGMTAAQSWIHHSW